VHDLAKIVRDFEEVADFAIVYICEAHPTDEWYWQNNVEIAQHKSLKERCEAAENMKNSSRCTVPVLVDTMADEATQAYGAFPERLVIVHHGRIVYLGGNGPYKYNLTEARRWLEEYKAEQ